MRTPTGPSSSAKVDALSVKAGRLVARRGEQEERAQAHSNSTIHTKPSGEHKAYQGGTNYNESESEEDEKSSPQVPNSSGATGSTSSFKSFWSRLSSKVGIEEVAKREEIALEEGKKSSAKTPIPLPTTANTPPPVKKFTLGSFLLENSARVGTLTEESTTEQPLILKTSYDEESDSEENVVGEAVATPAFSDQRSPTLPTAAEEISEELLEETREFIYGLLLKENDGGKISQKRLQYFSILLKAL